jgi:hypothetical protein
MTKPEGPFPPAGGGKNIVPFRGRKKFPGNLLPGFSGVRVLNIASGPESPGALTGAEIHDGGHHPGVGNAEIRVAAAKIRPSPGFRENFRGSFTGRPEPFPRRHPVQFPQNAPAFGV